MSTGPLSTGQLSRIRFQLTPCGLQRVSCTCSILLEPQGDMNSYNSLQENKTLRYHSDKPLDLTHNRFARQNQYPSLMKCPAFMVCSSEFYDYFPPRQNSCVTFPAHDLHTITCSFLLKMKCYFEKVMYFDYQTHTCCHMISCFWTILHVFTVPI